jgi:hypothetical protein
MLFFSSFASEVMVIDWWWLHSTRAAAFTLFFLSLLFLSLPFFYLFSS